MIEIKDQMNNVIRLAQPAKRIISLVPSQTEYLFDLGLDEKVVGITKFCVHPRDWFNSKSRAGGTKTVDFDKVRALKPDLIIANKEENTQTEIEALQREYNVFVSDIYTLNDAYKMMLDLGVLTDSIPKSKQIVASVQSNFIEIDKINKKVLYLIWKNPYMAAGQNTFINHLLSVCGFENALTNKKSRYEELSNLDISKMDVDYIFLSSEPFPFKNKHIEELQAINQAKILLVDGEMFSWYGSRLLGFKQYYNKFVKNL